VEIATLSQLPSINEAVSRRRHSLSFGHSGVWIRLLLSTKPYISPSRHGRDQDSLAPGGDNQVVRKKECRMQGGERERERERERENKASPRLAFTGGISSVVRSSSLDFNKF